METKSKNRREVRFCIHFDDTPCGKCDRSSNKRTAFHQIQTDITGFYTENNSLMIVDLGCPNTVIGKRDENKFIQSLSKYQQQNLKRVKTNEKFKFGPSGPYLCEHKLKFPVLNRSNLLWVEVALVQADIPMLLGNNILKPFGAEIKLFPKGNDGILKLEETEIVMRGTSGGHFAVKSADLAKLCGNFPKDEVNWICCEECGERFQIKNDLSNHMAEKHGHICQDEETCNFCEKGFIKTESMQYLASALKNKNPKDGQEKCANKVMTDLNTLVNGSKVKRERQIIETMKNMFQIFERKD